MWVGGTIRVVTIQELTLRGLRWAAFFLLSGRLKYLFLCGSVVIHVKYADRIAEFYENVLVPGEHYIVVDEPEEVRAPQAQCHRVFVRLQEPYTRTQYEQHGLCPLSRC